MKYIHRFYHFVDDYVISRWQDRPSPATFWYLPEPANLNFTKDLEDYQHCQPAPFYLMDYRPKLKYQLVNENNIIVLPYHAPIGHQINPEAAFQYALGLHDDYLASLNPHSFNRFIYYANYFLKLQNQDGLWPYNFNWFDSKKPWFSALAQGRGAAVMLRAYLHTQSQTFLQSAIDALKNFSKPTSQGGFLHFFGKQQHAYFEEYPKEPTAVLNGFMASLINIWELKNKLDEKWLNDLWEMGLNSLIAMLPFYNNQWWSLYDIDVKSPIKNLNSPRYHLLEIHYLQILSILSKDSSLANECQRRKKQYHHLFFRYRAFILKFLRKMVYR